MNLYYFCNHPYPLVIFSAIAQMTKAEQTGFSNRLIFCHHPYFDRLEYHSFFDYFDSVVHLPYADYSVLRGLKRAYVYKQSLKDILIDDGSAVFTISYSDFVTNLFCRHVRETSRNSRLIHLTIYGNFLDTSHGRIGMGLTLRDSLAALMFNGYPLRTYVDDHGMFIERVYRNDPHDVTYQLSSAENASGMRDLFDVLPFPVLTGRKKGASDGSRKRVLFFGDDTLAKFYPGVDPNKFYESLNEALQKIRSVYEAEKDVDIYYKAHPLDKESVSSRINLNSIRMLEEKMTAEMVYSLFQDRIKAVYSVGSTACLTGSYYGIPSYVLYRRMGFGDDMIRRFGGHFASANRESFLEVTSLSDIGSIDKRVEKGSGTDRNAPWKTLFHRLLNERSARG